MSAVPDATAPDSKRELTPPTDVGESALAASQSETTATGSAWVRASIFVVGAALVAAFLAWGIGEIMYGYHAPSLKAQMSRFDFTALNREQRAADQKNAAIAYGTFGALLGLLVGAAGGGLRRSIPAALSAASAGLLLGGIGGALVSYELVPIFAESYNDENPSLLLSLLVRGGICAVLGMTAGLAIGWGRYGLRGIPGALIGGLIGGVFGTFAFEVINGVAFPGLRNDAIIPSSMGTRLLAYLCVAVGVALGAVLIGRGRARPTSQ